MTNRPFVWLPLIQSLIHHSFISLREFIIHVYVAKSNTHYVRVLISRAFNNHILIKALIIINQSFYCNDEPINSHKTFTIVHMLLQNIVMITGDVRALSVHLALGLESHSSLTRCLSSDRLSFRFFSSLFVVSRVSQNCRFTNLNRGFYFHRDFTITVSVVRAEDRYWPPELVSGQPALRSTCPMATNFWLIPS